MSHTPEDSDRCEFKYASGRHCRMVRVAPEEQLCFRHWELEQRDDAAAKAANQIIGSKDSLDTEDAIHKALGNVFRQLVHNKISSRNAAVLGYLGQLMMGKCSSLERMLQSYLPLLQFAMKTRQHMDQSQALSDRHERYLVDLQFDLLDRILLMANSDQFKNMSAEERKELRDAIESALKEKGQAASAKTPPAEPVAESK